MASFGEKLRRERELRGVTLREIADATKISVRFLQAIEADRLDVLPGGIFPRAFVRQYADQLGLDAERIAAEFVGLQHQEAPETSSPIRGRRMPRWKGIAGALIALAVAFVVSREKVAHREQTPPVSASPTATMALPEDRVYPPPSTDAEEPPSQGLVLALSARRTCWVAVQVDGAPALNRTLREGETEVLEAQGEIVLSVGNAGGIAFTLNDRPGVPLGREGEVRRNIVITKQNLSSLVEEAPPVRTSRSS